MFAAQLLWKPPPGRTVDCDADKRPCDAYKRRWGGDDHVIEEGGVGAVPTADESFRTSGFTLIEVMVVVVVIALLAGLVAPNVFRNLGVARESTAESQAAMLAAALDAYRLDNGRYPTAEQGLAALWTEPQALPTPRSWAGPYLRRPPPLDPWDNPYLYTLQDDGRFRLATLGADGEEGGQGEARDVILW